MSGHSARMVTSSCSGSALIGSAGLNETGHEGADPNEIGTDLICSYGLILEGVVYMYGHISGAYVRSCLAGGRFRSHYDLLPDQHGISGGSLRQGG